ncbi:helix-turn-helix domain-containing protein [Niallia endozanthoxylica]|uniref:Helix-turn-helix transcriptional regulator n=1 Tax=Niallia endozanthoxylica TaxID=2036016 RepID=A0A5J5H4L0_9BACI|nr:helix-turn-helix transcriptional regulator [Niallia endozanthoxylica]KAA9014888.1 helix-turn-helix transcriptional regulator [Niallia endozanthoxylica]
MITDQDSRIPVTIYLKPSTVEQLKQISHYLAVREQQEVPLERIIRAAIADYIDMMAPLSDTDTTALKSLLFEPNNEKPYAIKNRFKEIMKQKGIKAVQIHRDTGISESNLSQLLNNKNLNMTLDSFLRIWLALDCPPIADCLYRENL